jgi:hypothetical protein
MASAETVAAKTTSAPSFLLSLNSPLDGTTGTIAFVTLAVITAIINLLLCSRFLGLQPPTKIAILQVFIVFLFAGWVAFSMSNSVVSFLVDGAAIALFYLPVVGMILTGSAILFWLSLVLMVSLAVLSVFSKVETSNPWSQLLIALYASWVVAGVVITLGSPKLIGYAQSSATLSEFHFLLDARYLITIVMLLTAFGDSMFKAFAAGMPVLPPSPKIRSLPVEDLPESGSALLIRPVFVFVNLFILICQALVNLIWQLVGLVVVYLYRTARNLANHFYILITDTAIVKAIGRVVVSFVAGLLLIFTIEAVVPDIVSYGHCFISYEHDLSLFPYWRNRLGHHRDFGLRHFDYWFCPTLCVDVEV